MEKGVPRGIKTTRTMVLFSSFTAWEAEMKACVMADDGPWLMQLLEAEILPSMLKVRERTKNYFLCSIMLSVSNQQFPEFLFRHLFEHKCSDGSHFYVRRACGSQRWVIAWSAKPEWEAVAFLNWETHLWFDKGLQELATTMHVERREWSPHRQAWLAAVASTVAKS